MNRSNLFGIGIVLAMLLVFAAPTTARTDDVTFYLNASDGSHEVNVAPGEEVTIYLDVYAPVNTTCGFEAGVMIDPDVLECLNVTENESLTDWYMWDFWGVWDSGFGDGKKYINFCSWDPIGIGPGLLRCGEMRVKAVNPGTTILYLGVKDVDIEDGNNNTMIIDYEGDSKDWTLAENFTFTCTGPADTFTKDLASGWNLVSLPLTPDDNGVSTMLNSITGNYDAVKSYNTYTNEFENATTMDPGTGYFIHMTTEGTWSYEGEAFNSMSEDLTTGLNCVGWENTNASLPDALSSIDYRYVSRWNANEQKYEVYDVNAPAGFNDFDMMERGEGYFIAATADCTLTP